MSFEHPPTEIYLAPESQLSPQEQFLRESLPAQFNTQTASLRAVGLLEGIFKENASADDDLVIELQEGITGMDGKAYTLPTLEQITKHFSQEKYAEKISQGFTKLLIVPFAYPLATIRARYEQALLKHHKAGKLLDRDGNRLELRTKKPLYFDKCLDKSDETGNLIYYPKQFDTENHGGHTKQELLNDPTQPFPGFHILLIKPNLTIPREGQEKTTGGRTDLGTDKRITEVLKTIQTDLQYRFEQGTTLEDSLTLDLTNLYETNRVVDDVGNQKDSVNFNIGVFRKASREVPFSHFDRADQCVHVFGGDPKGSHPIFGVRLAVG